MSLLMHSMTLYTVHHPLPLPVTIIVLDFNVRVGPRSSQMSSVISLHGYSEVNDNGKQLFDFCAGHDLIVSTNWFQHKPIHQDTWYRNDLVLINRKI